MLKAAILTRMGIGLLRIEENIPTANRKPHLTREQKYASLYERIFMEGFGVALHAASIYIFQEPISKFLEKSQYLKLPSVKSLKPEFLAKLNPAQQTAIDKAIQEVYNPNNLKNPKGIIAKQIYERDTLLAKVGDVRRAVARMLEKPGIRALPKEVLEGINKVLMGYQRRLWVASAVTLAFGVTLSAIITGPILQWMNDYVIAKHVTPWLNRKFKISPETPYRQVFLPGPVPESPAARTFRM